MNCKPGDLAVIVRSCCGNEGLIVTCVRISPHREVIAPGGLKQEVGVIWEVDRLVRDWLGNSDNYVCDSDLRPIRPQDGADETLAWKPVPLPQIEGQPA